MIPVLFMMWCLAAPMGFLAGDVFVHKNQFTDPEFKRVFPFLCAVLTPMGAIVAMVTIVQSELPATDTKEDENV